MKCAGLGCKKRFQLNLQDFEYNLFLGFNRVLQGLNWLNLRDGI